MYCNLFAGFKVFLEEKGLPYSFKNMTAMNIPVSQMFKGWDLNPIPPNFRLDRDENGRKDPGSVNQRTFEYDKNWIETLNGPPRFVKVVDVSGECGADGTNNDNQERACSPTHGWKFIVSLRNATYLGWPIPPGQQGGGGIGGDMGGGLGMGAPSAAPPPGIGASGPAGASASGSATAGGASGGEGV